ncbi:MAG: patatin-like phospholipase family protein [Proteobacteria bacterium]|nr:patatin-like phospholipase family protein [Pseudomonadota bacterium]
MLYSKNLYPLIKWNRKKSKLFYIIPFLCTFTFAMEEKQKIPLLENSEAFFKQGNVQYISPTTTSPGLSSNDEEMLSRDKVRFEEIHRDPLDISSLNGSAKNFQDHLLGFHNRITELEEKSLSQSMPSTQAPEHMLQSILTLEQKINNLADKIDNASRSGAKRPCSIASSELSDHEADHNDVDHNNVDILSTYQLSDLYTPSARHIDFPHRLEHHSSLYSNPSLLNNPSWVSPKLCPESLDRVKFCETLISPINSIRILVLDGGGIRGILELYFLALLEEETKKHTTELFHMMGGTSVGGQITALLNIKDSQTGKAKYSARFLLDYYLKHYPKVFQTKWHTLFGLTGEKYKTTPFKKLIDNLAGNILYQDGVIPTFATAYDLTSDGTSKLKVFSSKDKEKLSVKDVILATTAAPGYFKSHKASNNHEYMDGGIVANNPSLVGINLAYEHFSNFSKVVLVSLGTGFFPDSKEKYSSLRHVALWNIAKKIPHYFLRGQQEVVEESLQYRPDVIRFRFNPTIQGKSIRLDKISPEIIARLKEAALHSWIENREKIDELKRLLPLNNDSNPLGY